MGADRDWVDTWHDQTRLRDLGITDADRDDSRPWIPADSSNVHAYRWVGGEYGLEVRFLDHKSGGPGSYYAYKVAFSVYDDMFDAPSKGKFVHEVLRRGRVPFVGPFR